jgi:hypothetical protein
MTLHEMARNDLFAQQQQTPGKDQEVFGLSTCVQPGRDMQCNKVSFVLSVVLSFVLVLPFVLSCLCLVFCLIFVYRLCLYLVFCSCLLSSRVE